MDSFFVADYNLVTVQQSNKGKERKHFSQMKILSGVYWNKGKRTQNQDSVTLQQVVTGRGRIVLAAVSDGIGGLAEGETASGYITEKIVRTFYEQILLLFEQKKGKNAFKRCMLRSFYEINQELNRYAEEREIRLGATVSFLLMGKGRYMIFHLGDSRIYQCRGKKLKQLTEDHAQGGGLLKCLGSFGFQYPDIRMGRIRRHTGFLLCTDGFFKRMNGEEAGEVLSPKEIREEMQIEKRLQELGRRMLRRGETDNASAIYIQII